MAKFSLSLINKHGSTVLTDYDTMAGKTAGLTFDEHLNLSVDGSTLDFSMLKYLYEGSQKVVNTPAVSITYGSIIQCYHNGHRYDFAVTDIQYQFLSENLQLTFSAQDYFQFELSKLGIGYTITSDPTDPEFFGAQPIDTWAHKIIADNNIRWSYVPINQANAEWITLSLTGEQRSATFQLVDDNGAEYWEQEKPEYTLNQWVSFECSDSSVYNALKQLGNDNGLMLVVDYSTQNFWFAPKQNVVFNGYYFNPNNNLQQFGIKGSAQNLVTVLNITGPADLNNHEITLVPSFPPAIVNLILSDDWERSKYYPNLYTPYTNDSGFLREIEYAPWLENKLIDFSFFTANNLLMSTEAQKIQEILYNQLRIINGKLIVKQRDYLTAYGTQYQHATNEVISVEAMAASLSADVDGIYNLLFSDKPVCFASADSAHNPWIYWPKDYILYTKDVQGVETQVTPDSIRSGIHKDILSCPELDNATPKLYVTNPSILGGRKSLQYPIYIGTSSGDVEFEWFYPASGKVYYGGYIDTAFGAWMLPQSVNGVGGAGVTSATIHFPTWVTAIVIDIGQQGPHYPFKLYIDNGSCYCESSAPGSTSHQLFSGTPITIPNVGTLVASSPYEIAWTGSRATNWSAGILSIDATACPTIQWFGQNGVAVTAKPNTTSSTLTLSCNTTASDGAQLTIEAETPIPLNIGTTQVSLLQSNNNSLSIVVHEKIYDASSLGIQHIQVVGHERVELFARHSSTPPRDTNSVILTYDETIAGWKGSPYFQQLANALALTQFTTSEETEKSAIIVDMLNELCGRRDNYAQTLSKSAYELYTFWNQQYSTYAIGPAAMKMKTVSISSNPAYDILAEGQPYDDTNTKYFSTADLEFLCAALAKPSGTALLRTDAVAYIQSIYTTITEKWENCYAAAMGLGIYWPSAWDVSDWFVQQYKTLASDQSELVQLMSPLVLTPEVAADVSNLDLQHLTLNINLFPAICDTVAYDYVWDLSMEPHEAQQVYINRDVTHPIPLTVTMTLSLQVSEAIIGPVVPKTFKTTYTVVKSIANGDDPILQQVVAQDPELGKGGVVTYQLSYANGILSINYYSSTIDNGYGFDGSKVVLSAQVTQIDTLNPVTTVHYTEQFYDGNKLTYHAFPTITDNTQLHPLLITPAEAQTDVGDLYYQALLQHQESDALQLYKTSHQLRVERSKPILDATIVAAQILSLPQLDAAAYSASSYKANPNLFIIYDFAKRRIYDTQAYYTLLSKHDEVWQGLYQNYPGIFRESAYTNQTATNSQELYIAAKNELDNLCKPSYEYTLTGMDIYMHDSDYVPTRLKLGEQIRIDYQDPDQITDTLNAAIREPLYVTGISHALRNDGDYQFTVTTRTATDSMVQRFAQLLSYGR